MKGVAARYPAFVAALKRPADLEQRINMSRADDQKSGAKFPFESKELLAITAYVAFQSRGMPISVEATAQLEPFIAAGRGIYEGRQGQLNLSCAQCHNDNWGKSIAGNLVPQAHPTGYPIYRLEWQQLGSLQRRLRNCMSAMRAEPYPFGASLELVDLDIFLDVARPRHGDGNTRRAAITPRCGVLPRRRPPRMVTAQKTPREDRADE